MSDFRLFYNRLMNNEISEAYLQANAESLIEWIKQEENAVRNEYKDKPEVMESILYSLQEGYWKVRSALERREVRKRDKMLNPW